MDRMKNNLLCFRDFRAVYNILQVYRVNSHCKRSTEKLSFSTKNEIPNFSPVFEARSLSGRQGNQLFVGYARPGLSEPELKRQPEMKISGKNKDMWRGITNKKCDFSPESTRIGMAQWCSSSTVGKSVICLRSRFAYLEIWDQARQWCRFVHNQIVKTVNKYIGN